MEKNELRNREEVVVVVSMTTFPAAAPYAARAVRSILRGDAEDVANPSWQSRLWRKLLITN